MYLFLLSSSCCCLLLDLILECVTEKMGSVDPSWKGGWWGGQMTASCVPSRTWTVEAQMGWEGGLGQHWTLWPLGSLSEPAWSKADCQFSFSIVSARGELAYCKARDPVASAAPSNPGQSHGHCWCSLTVCASVSLLILSFCLSPHCPLPCPLHWCIRAGTVLALLIFAGALR